MAPVRAGRAMPAMRRWQIRHLIRDRRMYRRPGWLVGISGSRTLPGCAPMAWALSQVARSTNAGWTGAGDQIHCPGGTGRPLRLVVVLRVRPKTMWPVYLGLARIAVTVGLIHPRLSRAGYATGSALSRAPIAGTDRPPGTRHQKIWVTTWPRRGWGAGRLLVIPWAALPGAGCGTFSARYP